MADILLETLRIIMRDLHHLFDLQLCSEAHKMTQRRCGEIKAYRARARNFSLINVRPDTKFELNA